MEQNDAHINPPATTAIAVTSIPAQSFEPVVRVWLVDDDDEIRTLVADLLSHLGGIECARHFSSPDALLSALASRPGPDVILLDVQLGDRNGLDAVRPIKSLTRSTRVLMFTTSNNQNWRERALCEGASDYLLKSDSMEHVAARIRNPADDPAPGQVSRRRASCAPPKSLPSRQASSLAARAPHWLCRPLNLLRWWAN